MGSNLSAVIVFVEGMASFLSPCVLPLIPAYVTYLTGQSAEIIAKDGRVHRALIWNGLAFIIGFSIIFILMGATASSVGQFLFKNSRLFTQISGAIVIVFGLFHMGLLPVTFLNYEKRWHVRSNTPDLFSSMLMGMGFSFGWTPCIGPILSSVLLLASNTATIWDGVALLAIYALGLGVPFILIAIFLKYLWAHFRNLYKYMDAIKITSGAILILIGFLMIINKFDYLFTLP